MKCPHTGQPCNKTKLFHVTEVLDKKTISFDLCEDCIGSFSGKEEKLPPKAAAPSSPELDKKEPAPADVLKTMMEFLGFVLNPPGIKNSPKASEIPPAVAEELKRACPNCGSTLEEIAKTTKLGCPQCYEEFGEPLSQIIQQAHGAIKHVGKVPKNWKKRQEEKEKEKDTNPIKYLAEQNKGLNAAIKEERYEDASRFRDKLTVLEGLRKRLEKNINDEDLEQADLIREEIKRFIQLDRKKDDEKEKPSP